MCSSLGHERFSNQEAHADPILRTNGHAASSTPGWSNAFRGSRGREGQKIADVATGRCSQRCDVAGSGGSGIGEDSLATPRQRWSAAEVKVEVSHHAGLSAIAVDVRVDANEAMMDAYRNLRERKHAVVVPVAGVVEDLRDRPA